MLDFVRKGSIHAAMNEAEETYSLTSTQRGVIAETLISAQLMLVSGGRLSTFVPQADDDGLDLIVLDKVTRKTIPIQIKAWFASENDPPATVQFDTRLKTFREQEGTWLLCAIIDPETAAVWRVWLIPATELRSVASVYRDKLAITPSPSLKSADRYAPYRSKNIREAARTFAR